MAIQLARAAPGILALLLFLLACGAETATPPPRPSPTAPVSPTVPTSRYVEATPANDLALRGTFVYAAGDGSLWRQAVAGGEPAALVERSTEAIAQQPAISSDGETVAYSALLFLSGGAVRGDLRGIGVDGANARTLVRADVDDVVYMYPRYAPDGRLLATRIEQMQMTNERATLEWIDLAGGGTRRAVIADARDADVTRDGRRIAFVRYDVERASSALWLADADGKNERELVGADVFPALLSPRFSPDGEWLAFGAHGTPRRPLPRVARWDEWRTPMADDCGWRVLWLCLARTVSAHAAPGALWRVHLASGKFEALTDIYDDTPALAWSRDGTRIAIHDFTGIRLIQLDRREIYPLFLEDGGTGGFDWYDP